MNQTSKGNSINYGARGAGPGETGENQEASQPITERKQPLTREMEGAFACSFVHQVAAYGGNTSLVVHARGVGAAIASLAQSAGGAFARKWESGSALDRGAVLKWRGGRKLMTSDIEEITAIYHSEFAAAFVGVGVVPASWRALRVKRGNALTFRQLRVWLKAARKARTTARSYLYGGGAENVLIVSKDDKAATMKDLQGLAAWFNSDNCKDETADREDREKDWLIKGGSGIDTPWNRAGIVLNPKRLRRWRNHALWCLRAYWMAGASRKWRAGFEGDYAILRAAAAVASGAGLETLCGAGLGHLLNDNWRGIGGKGKGGKGGANHALHDRLRDLKAHIASGDLLLTDQPEKVAGLLMVHLGERIGGKAARSLVDRNF
jgi:hypothetical protein